MKYPAGPAQPRRRAAPRKKQVRLNLRRSSPPPPPGDSLDRNQQRSFWKWFFLVALFHVLLLIFVMWVYHSRATPPPESFISLVPQGDTVKGTPGEQAAPKVGPSTPAPTTHRHHTEPKPPTPPEPQATPPPQPAAKEPPPEKIQPKIIQPDAPKAITKPKPPKPPKPAKPKIKVDLHLQDAPATDDPNPVKPPKKHVKKATPPPSERNDDRDSDNPDNMGLSKEQIAAKLGKRLAAEGVTNSTRTGISGSAEGHNSAFADFYGTIREQVMNKWQVPNIDVAQANNPIVQFHAEKNGRITPGSVVLLHSSGNQAIDDSALATLRSIDYLLQPLPDGCPPDISITFNLDR